MGIRRRRILWIAIALAAAALIAYPKIAQGMRGNGDGGKGTAQGSSGQGGRGPGVFKVQVMAQVVRPRRMDQTLVSTGTLRAGDAVQLKSETSGRIVQLPFKEGSHVPKGKLLVKINDADLRAQLTKARAALGLAEATEERQRQLAARNFISQQEFDQARQAVQSARGDIELIQAQIDKTEIHAPFNGVVGLSEVSVGGLIAQGAPIANFVSDGPLKVDFAVPQQYYDSVAPGKRVTFTIQGGDRVFTAKVFAVDPLVDQATRTVNVRAQCDGTDKALAPGAFARLTLVVSDKPDALAVPSQSLVPSDSGQQVFVLRQGKAAVRRVKTGLRTEADVEIVEGLRPGDTVITSGLSLIRPGAPVDLKGLDTLAGPPGPIPQNGSARR